MEALVYEESPLADYLEIRQANTTLDPPEPPPSFAPIGWDKLRSRVRAIRRRATNLAPTADEPFLEQFRYLIIASQLLEEETRAHPPKSDTTSSLAQDFTLTGAAATAALSFVVVWALSSARRGPWSGVHWTRLCLTAFICAGSLAVVLVFGRRRYLRHTRQTATRTLSNLLEESHSFDGTFNVALRLIQEVEIVARGYELSTPLPPISRLEKDAPDWRCETLRRTLADALTSMTSQFVEVHNLAHRYTSDEALKQYRGIYDISLPEYFDAVSMLNAASPEARGSLRDLRFSFKTLALARKVLLCDLLALPSDGFWQNTQQLTYVTEKLHDLASETTTATETVKSMLHQEESRTWSEGKDQDQLPKTNSQEQNENKLELPVTPGKQQAKAQMRRLDKLAIGIRALNAKLLLFQQEAETVADIAEEASQLPSTLSKQYESLGADIKGLLAEWEQGKKMMLLSVNPLNRYSRSSSGLRSPCSPSPSLGGLTMVDDGPADALRVLNGDDMPRKLSDFGTSDEEVFEAVALPRRLTSLMLSRDERMAKIQEDRKKRATMQEHADRTTHMLKELEMVIKHRPRGRTTSRITTV